MTPSSVNETPQAQATTLEAVAAVAQAYRGRSSSASSFLSLAPTTSNSYPTTQRKPAAGNKSAAAAERRKNSIGATIKVLKLGPVHWGEHQDDHKEDWHEVAVA